MFFEIPNYEIEGAALKDGKYVDGHALKAEVKRRAQTAEDGPDGPVVPIYVPLSTMSARRKARLIAAYEELESVVREIAEEEYAKITASPATLDETIAKADAARAELAELDAKLAAKRAELQGVEARNG